MSDNRTVPTPKKARGINGFMIIIIFAVVGLGSFFCSNYIRETLMPKTPDTTKTEYEDIPGKPPILNNSDSYSISG